MSELENYGDSNENEIINQSNDSLNNDSLTKFSLNKELENLLKKWNINKEQYLKQKAIVEIWWIEAYSMVINFIKSNSSNSNKIDSSEKSQNGIDEKFEEKFSEVIVNIEKTKQEIKNDSSINDENKTIIFEKLDNLRNDSSEKAKIKDYFTKQAESFLSSSWLNEKTFVNDLHLDIWLFSTASWKVLPWIGISYWRKLDVSDPFGIKDGTLWLKWPAWITIFWVYAISWWKEEANYNDIKNDSFTICDKTTAISMTGGNIWSSFDSGFSYWWGVFYVESKNETINEKAKLLETLLNWLKWMSLDEISLYKMPNVSEEEGVLIKNTLINELTYIWYNNNDKVSKDRIFDMYIQNKINQFINTVRAAEFKNISLASSELDFELISWYYPILKNRSIPKDNNKS